MKKRIKKNCLICNKEFTVPSCLNRMKFCSRLCYVKEWSKRIPGWNKGLKGIQTAWNKGKKCPHMWGKKHPRWKGGRDISHGYVRIQLNGKAVLEHRLIMMKKLGRKLMKTEHIHHINGIKTDNRLENLIIVTQKEHMDVFHRPQLRGGTEERQCINCNKKFTTFLSNNAVFCTKECFYNLRKGNKRNVSYK